MKFIKVLILASVIASGVFGFTLIESVKIDDKQVVAMAKPILPEPEEPYCWYPPNETYPPRV